MKNNHPPLFLDEVQYVPELFPYLKLQIDQQCHDGDFLMTGSQAFVFMKNVSESLAGRVGILELQGFSLREARHCDYNQAFIPTDDYIQTRSKTIITYDRLREAIHRGHMPELVLYPDKD